jgi:transposase
MRKSRLCGSKQHNPIEHFVAGTTARCASELVDVNRKVAAYYYHRWREIITEDLDKESTE